MQPIPRIACILALAALLCQGAYLLFDKGYTRYYDHRAGRLSELLEKNTRHDVLFIGSSRTYVHINPRIIDSVCQTDSYNAGLNGGNLFEFQLLLSAYLLHHPPPVYLVLTLDIPSFDLPRDFFSTTPYIGFTHNRTIASAMKKNGFPVAWYSVLPFLQLTAYDDEEKHNALAGLKGDRAIPPERFQYKGFLSNNANVLGPKDTLPVPIQYKEISDSSLLYLDHIVDLCRANKIKLILTYAPEYHFKLQERYSDRRQVFDTLSAMAVQHQLPYWRHDSLAICTDPALFANVGHLNQRGADVYSVILGRLLRETMRKSQN
jgi:hypothetical protein